MFLFLFTGKNNLQRNFDLHKVLSPQERQILYVWNTLESGIDVGQGITVGPGKFVKKNKRRALNKRRA